MNVYVKFALSAAGIFLGGVTALFQVNPTAPTRAYVMAGLTPLAGYLIGFYQVNPANQPAKKKDTP